MSKYTLAKSLFVAGSSIVAGAQEDSNEASNLRGSGRNLYLVDVIPPSPPPKPSPFDNINNGWLHDGFDHIDAPASDINAWWGGDAFGSVSGGTIHYGGTHVNEGSEFHGVYVSGSASSGKSGKGSSGSGFSSGKSGKGSYSSGFSSGKSGKGSSGSGFSSGKSGKGSSDSGFGSGKSGKGSSYSIGGKSGKGSSNSNIYASGSGYHGIYVSGSDSVSAGKSGKGSSSSNFSDGKSGKGSSGSSFSSGKSGNSGPNPIESTPPFVEPTWYSDGYVQVRTRGMPINDGLTASVATPEQLGDRPQSTFRTDETVDCREIIAGHPAVCVKVCTTIKSVFDGSTLVDESATTMESECD